ncbi:MAG: deoxyribodipyrimidine photolyase [Gemmatimonadota bacterium]|nr:deoxyribodipyrimidine photolyase [Gemmatimonadota bacterium]
MSDPTPSPLWTEVDAADPVGPVGVRGRVRVAPNGELNREGNYVLYWMTSARRLHWNHALDRAVAWCVETERPLVILEALRAGYDFASHRLHRFVMDGMAEKAEASLPMGVTYLPYVETSTGSGAGLLETLMEQAALVVGDDFPTFFLPNMLAAAAARSPVRFEIVDGNGLLPMGLPGKAYPSAYHFRRFLQKSLPDWLDLRPEPDPFRGWAPRPPATLPESVDRRWPPARREQLLSPSFLAGLPIDGEVAPVPYAGGEESGVGVLDRFLRERLQRYAQDGNHPDRAAVSALSPYLHFGHVSAHQVFAGVSEAEGWTPLRLGEDASGKREGWWGMGESAEAFLEQLVTWRELGFNMSRHEPAHREFKSLPAWARATLGEHREDPRSPEYDRSAFLAAETHDPVWNAAQRELLATGRIHNYLRMLWGKKILEWSETPEMALATMIELNDRFAVDGRDPNSYAGIFWILGRYDRPWPERAVYGKVRSMSSGRTRKKVDLEHWLEEHGS